MNPKVHLLEDPKIFRRIRRLTLVQLGATIPKDPRPFLEPVPERPVSLLLRVTVPSIHRSGFRLSGPRWSGASGFPLRRDRKSRPQPGARQIQSVIDFRESLIGFRESGIRPPWSRQTGSEREKPRRSYDRSRGPLGVL